MLSTVTTAASSSLLQLYHLPGFYEPFAAISHLCGAALFVVLGLILLRHGSGGRLRVTLLSVYVAANVFQFSMSGLYHMMIRGSAAHQLMGKLDHAAVYLLIAGTFTPVYGLLYQGRLRRALLIAVWTAAVAGILFTTFFAIDVGEGLRLGLYLGLGWSGIVAMIDLWRRYGFAFIWPLLAGSAMTSLAALCQEFGWPTLIPGVIHAHETFHVILLIGSFQHWLFIWQFADGTIGNQWKNACARLPASRILSGPHFPIALAARAVEPSKLP
ncbi:MAG TPA: hemolysin III family protein [Pirellulales bacterium]|jgi:channel protein (hemolysin III family)|nr:hemolysin III family protein [Pirellulales bacterium]